MSEPESADERGSDDDAGDRESPMVVFNSDEGRIADVRDDDEAERPSGSALQSAFDCLEIRVPVDELRSFGEKRIQTLVRLNETEKAGLVQAALEEGVRAIRQVMGARASEEAR